MKISIKWLENHIDLINNDIITIEKHLLKLGFEVTQIEYINLIQSCTIEHIETINSKLSLCTITTHHSNITTQVVCGAKNLSIGMTTLYAAPGTTINSIKLEKKKFLGYYSDGMLLSHDEVTSQYTIDQDKIKFNSCDNNGIIDIKSHNITLYKDIVLHSEIATNRWDLNNIRGIARQLCFFGLGRLKKLSVSSGHRSFPNSVVNYTSIKTSFVEIKNIKIPEKIIDLCNNIGIFNKNDLQYLNDFILIDIGHPIHIYDKKYFNSVTIENANNQSIKTITNDYFQCTNQEILIKDHNNPISIGGIVGVKGYEENSVDVVIEACWFQPYNISKTITESSVIFNLGIDNQLSTLEYISHLVHGDKTKIVYFGSLETIEKPAIFLCHSYFYLMTGLTIKLNTLFNLLNSSGFDCKIIKKKQLECLTDEFGLSVTIPSYRQDIKCNRDLIEEIMIWLGYEVFDQNEESDFIDQIDYKESLEDSVINLLSQNGFHQVYNLPFTFISSKIKIINSLNKQRTYFRDSPLYSLMENASTMLKHGYQSIRLFEINHGFLHVILGGKHIKTWLYEEKNNIFFLKKVINQLKFFLNISEQYTINNHIFFQGYQLNCGKMGILKFNNQFSNIKDFCYLEIKIIPNICVHDLPSQKETFDISLSSSLLWDQIKQYINVQYCMFDVYEKDNIYKYAFTVFSKKDYHATLDNLIKNNIVIN